MSFSEYLKIPPICNANAVSSPRLCRSTIWFIGFQSENSSKFFSFQINQRLHRFKLSFGVKLPRFKCEEMIRLQQSTFLKVTAFPCGSQNGQAFQKCVHLVFQNLPLSVNSKLTSRSQCEPFLQLESDLSRALSKTFFNLFHCQLQEMSINICVKYGTAFAQTFLTIYIVSSQVNFQR